MTQREDIREQVVRLQEQMKSQTQSAAEFRATITTQVTDLRAAVQGDLQSIKATLNAMSQQASAWESRTKIGDKVVFGLFSTFLAFCGAVAFWAWQHVLH